MQKEFLDEMKEKGESSYLAMQELGEINSNALKEMYDLQMNMASYGIGSGMEFTKSLGSVGSYNNLLSAKPEYISEYSDRLMEYGRKASSIITEAHDGILEWFEKTVENNLSEPKKTTVKTTSNKKAR